MPLFKPKRPDEFRILMSRLNEHTRPVFNQLESQVPLTKRRKIVSEAEKIVKKGLKEKWRFEMIAKEYRSFILKEIGKHNLKKN